MPHESRAQVFTVKVTDYGGPDNNALLKEVLDNKLLEFQNDINSKFPSGSAGTLMKGMANSTMMAGKGAGQDYASTMQLYLVEQTPLLDSIPREINPHVILVDRFICSPKTN